MSNLLTNSRLKAKRACDRLHHIRYELGYQSIHENGAPRFGTLFHKGLETWWGNSALPPDNRLALSLEAMSHALDPFERVKAEEMMRGYHFRWIDEPYRVIAVEAEFAGPLRNPQTGVRSRTWTIGGKLDVLVVDLRDELARIVEHKTSNEDISQGSEYWRRLRMDGQVSMYYEGASLLGHNVAGCVYDVIGKPAIRPGNVPLLDEDGIRIVLTATGARVRTKDGKKWRQTADAAQGFVLQTRTEMPEEYRDRVVETIANNPDRYFQRGEVVRLEAEMEEAMFEVWQIGRAIREGQIADRHPRNPDACARYGKTCSFFNVCSGQASLDDPSMFVKLNSVHPELAGTTPEATPEEKVAAQ